MEDETDFEKLARMIKNGFDAVDERFTSMDARFTSVDERFDALDEKFEETGKKIVALDRKFDGLHAALTEYREETATRFDALESVLGGAVRLLNDHDKRISNLEHELAP